MDKSLIRKDILEKRSKLTTSQVLDLSAHITHSLFELPEYNGATDICTYIDYNNEVITKDIIKRSWQLGKNVASPKVTGKDMEFVYIGNYDELEVGAYNIMEPIGNEIFDLDEGLIIMPGVAFDENKNRIGYGGGFYDRYLAKHPKCIKIAIAYDFQILPEIESEPFDIKPDIIITDRRIIL